jgi:hypothetical protein
MTRTEDDIRATLRDIARTAATADDVLHRLVTDEPVRPRRLRREYLLIAGVCLLVAAITASAVLISRHSHARQPAVESPTKTPGPKAVESPIKMPLGPKFAFSFEMSALPAGLAIESRSIEPTLQLALIGRKLSAECLRLMSNECEGLPRIPPANEGMSASVGENGYLRLGYVIVYSAGAFDPTVMTGATPVDVDGAAGLLANVALANPGTARVTGIGTPPWRVPTVAWQYAKDSWAVAAWRNDIDAHARALTVVLARATRIGGSHRALVPFGVGYLPAVVDRRVKLTYGGVGTQNAADFGNAASTNGLFDQVPDHSLGITLDPLSEIFSPRDCCGDGIFKSDVWLSVAGHAARYSAKMSTLYVSCGARCTLVIGQGSAAGHLLVGVTKAELIKVAERITLARSLTDTSTWFDAATALPH